MWFAGGRKAKWEVIDSEGERGVAEGVNAMGVSAIGEANGVSRDESRYRTGMTAAKRDRVTSAQCGRPDCVEAHIPWQFVHL